MKFLVLLAIMLLSLISNGSENVAKHQLYYIENQNDFFENTSNLPYIPLMTRRAVNSPAHQRWNKDHFASKVWCSWNTKGLMLSFKIKDREVKNNASLPRLWSQDCLEIFLDVRKNKSSDYSGNALHLFIAPPNDNSVGRYYVRDNRPLGKELLIKSFITHDGWSGQVFIPWDSFQDFEALENTNLGLGIQICDDYGRPENNPFFVAQYLRFGQDKMAHDATLLPRWILSKEYKPSINNNLANVMAIDVPNIVFDNQIVGNIVISTPFKKEVSKIEYFCQIGQKNINGKSALDKLKITLPKGIYGKGIINVKVFNPQNKVAGILTLPFERFNGKKIQDLQNLVFDTIKSANLPQLVKNNPHQIPNYFGLLNNLEQLKRIIFLEKIFDIDEIVEEITLRIKILKKQKIETKNNLFKLLNLTANLDAQISIEYPRYHPTNTRKNNALIKFYCGSIPLARVNVKYTEQQNILQPYQVPSLYKREMMPNENKNNLLFYFTVGANHNHVAFFDLKSLDAIRNIDAIVINNNAPLEHTKVVNKYAQKNNIPILAEKDLTKGTKVIYVGRPDTSNAISKILPKAYKLVWSKENCYDLIVPLKDNLVAHIICISPLGAKLIADVLLSNQPFTQKDNLLLTKYVASSLKDTNIKNVPIPLGYDLMAADVHCHSIYSDGLLTPLGLLAAALYSQMDFLLITDHETAEGALELQRELQKYNFDFPLIAGEENSLPDGHFNSYPLTKSIPPNLSFKQLIKTANQQGAIVQYNHPATYSNREDLQRNGLKNSGLVAWEHEMPPYAKNWPELPAQIGSSDNHNTSFPCERTLTLAQNINSQILKSLILEKKTAMLEVASSDFIYGPSFLKGMLLTALENPQKYLLNPYYQRLQKFLKNANIEELYKVLPGSTPYERGEK